MLDLVGRGEFVQDVGGARSHRFDRGSHIGRLCERFYEKVFAGDRWTALAAAGAKPQRPLWASTGVKDPAYEDTRYVIELVAPGVVNTMPEATLDAVADHGQVRGDTVTTMYEQAHQIEERLAAVGIDYDDVVQTLEDEGVKKFEDSFAEMAKQVSDSLKAAGDGSA